jgi:hypothetical protein
VENITISTPALAKQQAKTSAAKATEVKAKATPVPSSTAKKTTAAPDSKPAEAQEPSSEPNTAAADDDDEENPWLSATTSAGLHRHLAQWFIPPLPSLTHH